MRKIKYGAVVAVVLTMVLALGYMHVPTLAEQPGSPQDPLVTRRYVDERVAALEARIAVLEAAIMGHVPIDPGQATGGGFTQEDRDAMFLDFLQYFDLMYGNLLRQLFGDEVPFPGLPTATTDELVVLNVPAGRVITFEGGAEFILRAGSAVVIAGENGIVNVTEGIDVANGELVAHNNLMLVPATDGRGVVFTTGSWVIVRGGHTVVGN